MASIKKRPDGRWRARYRDPQGKERARHFATKGAAQSWLNSTCTDVESGAWVDPSRSRASFRGWSDQWLAESVHLKAKTRAGYESILVAHLLPRWGDVPVGQIDRPAIKAWIAEMVAAGKGAGTIKNVANTMSAVMRSAVEGGAVKVNPCAGVRLPRPERSEMVFLTAEQVGDLADTIDPEYRTLILTAAYTGLRAGELAALRWERVDLLRATIDVVESYAEVHGELILGATKTYQRRTVRLPRFLADLLGEHQAVTGPKGLVFRSPTGEPLRQSNFYRRVFRPAVARTGLPAARFHDLRHSCAAMLIDQGAHPLAVKERLGHSSITVTLDVYGHLMPKVDETLADGLDATYWRAVADQTRTNRGLDAPRHLHAREPQVI